MELNNLRISERVLLKLEVKHEVTIEEIEQCFANCENEYLIDDRLNRRTNPPTLWFIAETDFGRRLKIVFIKLFNGMLEIKTAYEPNAIEEKIYEKNDQRKNR